MWRKGRRARRRDALQQPFSCIYLAHISIYVDKLQQARQRMAPCVDVPRRALPRFLMGCGARAGVNAALASVICFIKSLPSVNLLKGAWLNYSTLHKRKTCATLHYTETVLNICSLVSVLSWTETILFSIIQWYCWIFSLNIDAILSIILKGRPIGLLCCFQKPRDPDQCLELASCI